MDTQVLGLSMDSPYANRVYAEQLKLTFPLLSDWKREVVRQDGVYNENNVAIYRTTFVLDKNGIVQSIQQGAEAVDITGAREACSKIHAPKP